MKTIIENADWSIPSLIENKSYKFNKENILRSLPEKFIDEAVLEISKWETYVPTPLYKLNKLKTELGFKEIYYKDEDKRFNLKSFKALGGAFAVNKIANESDLITLKIIFRDEHEELMNFFLTNGGKSIPKLLVLNSENEVLNTWGPRPSIATKIVQDYKNKHGQLDKTFKKELQVWYNNDKGVNIQENMIGLLAN